jgi:DNA-binding CsgD family transcriptional regulator
MAGARVETLFSEMEFGDILKQMDISPREGQIIEQILLGYSDKQIAENLDMAVPTIRTHLKRTFSKLGVNGRGELIVHVFAQFRKECRSKGCPRCKASSMVTTS